MTRLEFEGGCYVQCILHCIHICIYVIFVLCTHSFYIYERDEPLQGGLSILFSPHFFSLTWYQTARFLAGVEPRRSSVLLRSSFACYTRAPTVYQLAPLAARCCCPTLAPAAVWQAESLSRCAPPTSIKTSLSRLSYSFTASQIAATLLRQLDALNPPILCGTQHLYYIVCSPAST